MIESQNPPTSKISSTIAYYYAFIILGLITGIFGPTLVILARQTRTTLSEISIIFAARSFAYLIGSLLWGRLFDRIRGHPLIVAMLFVIATTFALIPLMPELWLLVAVVIVLGIAEGGVDVGGNSLLIWMHRENAGPFLNGLHFFFGVGALISPIVVAQVVLSTGGIVWAYWVLALVALPAAAWLMRLASPAPRHDSHQEKSVRPSSLLVTAFTVFFFLYVGAEVGYGNWIYTYATKLNLSDATSAALLTSAFWGAFTFGRLMGIPLSTRFQPAPILLVDLVGVIASVIGILLFAQSTTALWLGTIATGLFMASIFPTTLALAGRRMTVSGETTGLFFVGGGGGSMFLPWLIGQYFEPVGASITMILILASFVIAGGVFVVVLGRREPKGSTALS